MIFDHGGAPVARDQLEHEQIFPRPGWVEHDPAEIWQRARQVIDGALGQLGGGAATSSRWGSPTSARRRSSGIARPGDRSTTRSCGRTRAPTSCCAALAADGGADRFRAKTGLPIATYFSGPEDRVDPRPRRRRARAGRGRRAVLRHGRHVADLEPDRRTGRRRPRDRRQQRQPDAADGPAHARVGRRAARRDRRAAGDAARDPLVERGLRRGPRRGAGRRAGRRRPRRPAGGDVRPGVLCARRGEEHLRDRQLPAAQHGHRGRAVRERADHDGRLPARRRARRVLPRGLDRRHRLAGPVAARQPAPDPLRRRGRGARAQRRRQRRRLLRAGVLRACSRRTGAPTRAA